MDLEHEKRLTAVEETAKSNERRITEMEKRQDDLDDLVSTVKVLALREEVVEKDVKEIKSDVKKLTDKPAQRWDEFTSKVLWMIVAAVVTYFLTKLGL